MIAKKLRAGDHIRVIAPADSLLPKLTDQMRERAVARLNEIGLTVSFGKHVSEIDQFSSTSVENRLEDLHDAFSDPSVSAIMAVSGGTSSNQLLDHIDYSLIRRRPKVLIGLSDITALVNAIFVKTGLMTYYGPHFNVFGACTEIEYTRDYFQRCLFKASPIRLLASADYFESEWDDTRFENSGFWIMNNGMAEGTVIGGNLLTYNFLQGSEYVPSVDNAILILEDNGAEGPNNVENQLQSLINQSWFATVRGILIGRFKSGSKVTREKLFTIIKTKPELEKIPIIANVDFGHTAPMVTFPIGGRLIIDARDADAVVEIVEH